MLATRHWKLVIGALAAVLVGAACGSGVGAQVVGEGSGTVASFGATTIAAAQPDTDALDVARSYVDARNRWDAAAAMALFHPDAIVIDSPVGSLDDQADLFAYHEVLDWRWVVRDCFQTPQGTTAEITCTYSSENAWSRALGEGLVPGQIRFAITDGKIAEMYHDYNVAEWDQRIVNPFRAWLRTNRPDLDDELWTPEGFLRPEDADRGLDERVGPQLTEEALAQFAALAAEFAVAAR